ncbi:MAG TPA: hypothetical protein VM347_37285, partial [Nonomuraea sp.]|nr:hypothetical protein [Nonomuraea sp.]
RPSLRADRPVAIRSVGSGLVLRRADDRGSALLLIPTVVLLILILGGIAADAAVVTGAQRQLRDIAAAAANDATAAAIDDRSFYIDGEIRLDHTLAVRQANAAVAASAPHPFDIKSIRVDVAGDTVTVRATATVEHIFAKAIPGVARASTVSATSTAVARSR